MRVASLLPSATETLFALGVEPVGVSHSCDYPAATDAIPTLTDTVVEHENRSATEIDAQMRSVDGAVYNLDVDRLAELCPDLVVTQATCDICAVDATEVRSAAASLDPAPTVLALDPHSFDDVIDDVARIGDAVGREGAAAALTGGLRERVSNVRERAAKAVDADGCPRTAVLDWTDPPIRAGHWVGDMVAAAGGDPSFQPDGASEPVAWDDLRAWDPEVLVVAPCGFGRDRAVDAVGELAERPGWQKLTAAVDGRVYAVDGNALFNRPSHRLVDSLEALLACVHPRHAAPDATVDLDCRVVRVDEAGSGDEETVTGAMGSSGDEAATSDETTSADAA